ncbi:hypothetical protein CHARACLAT_018544 [Characodon lateralis]|uniref:Uncharacterized protein n=1 Tax=Characodon lateralis TaxID=208331 RepID=A0ABU7DS78_9TELE|nr:hypothetical protein [Characodon lateralis]
MAVSYSGVGHRTTESNLPTHNLFWTLWMCGENHKLGKETSGEQLLRFPALSGRFSQGVAHVAHLQRFQPVRQDLSPPPSPLGMGLCPGYAQLPPTFWLSNQLLPVSLPLLTVRT